jgi:DUF4097 and DUF4098 domain-containing protein YvlB
MPARGIFETHMRRGSLFAPLLLIGLGLIFLARNLHPDLRLMDYLARYWPLLLVLWGVMRTLEILFWASSKQPLPARGVTGGEWMLVLLLCFFGSTLHAVRGFAGWFPGTIELGGLDVFGESYDYAISGDKASGKTPHVVIESFRGNARITGTDTASVTVTGHKTVRSIDRDGADRTDRETPMELTGDAGTIVIRTNQNRSSGLRQVTADMEIAVPKGASIEAHGRNGDFDIQDIDGAVAITSQNTSVRLTDIGGAVRLDLAPSRVVRAVNLKGTLDLEGGGSDVDLENIGGGVTMNGPYIGNVEFHNLSGSIHLKGPATEFSAERIPGDVRTMALHNFNASNLVGPVHIATRLRDVQISDFTNALDVSVDNGDIELRPALPLSRMDVHTHSGNITLALPKDGRFALSASTGMGRIMNQFGSPLVLEESRRNATLRGANGGPEVMLRSDRGEITVREALPGEPPFEPRFGPRVLPKQLKSLKEFSKKLDQ